MAEKFCKYQSETFYVWKNFCGFPIRSGRTCDNLLGCCVSMSDAFSVTDEDGNSVKTKRRACRYGTSEEAEEDCTAYVGIIPKNP